MKAEGGGKARTDLAGETSKSVEAIAKTDQVAAVNGGINEVRDKIKINGENEKY